MKVRIDEIEGMARAQEFAELLVEMEPVRTDDLLIAFDDRVDEHTSKDVIDIDALHGWDLFASFTHCYDGALMADSYDYPPPRGSGDGYVRYITDYGLDVFELERKKILPVEEHDEFQYPRHRCDHENETRDDPRCEGRLCLDCGRVMVGSFERGWVGG